MANRAPCSGSGERSPARGLAETVGAVVPWSGRRGASAPTRSSSTYACRCPLSPRSARRSWYRWLSRSAAMSLPSSATAPTRPRYRCSTSARKHRASQDFLRDHRPFPGADRRLSVHPRWHLAPYAGLMPADDYAASSGCMRPRASRPIVQAVCRAHAQREFFDLARRTKAPITFEAMNAVMPCPSSSARSTANPPRRPDVARHRRRAPLGLRRLRTPARAAAPRRSTL